MMTNKDTIEIDGSIGEGGGSILRLSAGYSFLYNTPVTIKKIRANRPKPGLRMQHLLGLKLLAKLTNSTLSKCDVGSKEISFFPKEKIDNRHLTLNVPTAASIGLLLQPLQIACLNLKASESINIYLKGGATFGKWAPSLNYLEQVTYSLFENSGLKIKLDVFKQGFYPKGGAQVKCQIKRSSAELKPINLTTLSEIETISGEIIITNQLKSSKRSIPRRIESSIKSQLKGNYHYNLDIEVKWVKSLSPGVGLCLWAESDNGTKISSGTMLGERNVSSERLGRLAIENLLKYIKNDIPVDNYLSDQLIPLIAYIEKASRIKVIELTNHTKTNLELIKRFSKRQYEIRKEENAFFINFY